MNARLVLKVLFALAIPSAVVLGSAAPALADAPPAAAVSRGAPISRDARVQRFVLAPRGQVVGLVLEDGSVVHVPARGASQPTGALKAGDAVHVQGNAVQTPTGVVVTRAIVQKNGAVISDGTRRGERGQRRARGEGKRERAQLAQITSAGRITSIISTPRGKAHALLLDDGTTASARGIESLGLRVGDRVSVTGKGGAYAQGKAVHIQTITLPNGEVRTLAEKARRRAQKSAPL